MTDPSEVLGASNMLRSRSSICSHIHARANTRAPKRAGTHKRTHTHDLEVTSQQRSVAEEDFFFCVPRPASPFVNVALWQMALLPQAHAPFFLMEGESEPSLASFSRSVLWSFHRSDGCWGGKKALLGLKKQSWWTHSYLQRSPICMFGVRYRSAKNRYQTLSDFENLQSFLLQGLTSSPGVNRWMCWWCFCWCWLLFAVWVDADVPGMKVRIIRSLLVSVLVDIQGWSIRFHMRSKNTVSAKAYREYMTNPGSRVGEMALPSHNTPDLGPFCVPLGSSPCASGCSLGSSASSHSHTGLHWSCRCLSEFRGSSEPASVGFKASTTQSRPLPLWLVGLTSQVTRVQGVKKYFWPVSLPSANKIRAPLVNGWLARWVDV